MVTLFLRTEAEGEFEELVSGTVGMIQKVKGRMTPLCQAQPMNLILAEYLLCSKLILG